MPEELRLMRRYAAACCKDILRVVKNLNALVYVRVSTEEQAEKGYSIQAQKTEGIKRAIELGCSSKNIFIFSDEGVSGAILERPQLMAALDMIKKSSSNVRYFICYDSSRLSRNAAHQLIIIDEIKRCNTQLVFLKNNYQDNAEGRFQLTVMAAVDEYERARLKLRTEMGKRAKASQHKLTHNPGLYGYDFDPITDTLNINEEQAQYLKIIFGLVTEEHKGPVEIAEKLNASDVPSPRMKQWSRVTVRRILANPSYLGVLYIRRYDTRDCHLNKFKKKGDKIKVKEKPQNEWVPIQIPQIIDRDTWEIAQNILEKTRHSGKRRDKADFLLTPLLRCRICGSAMNGKSIVRGDSTYRYYICTGKYKGLKEERCETMLIRADDVEKIIWDYIYRSICFFISKEMDLDKNVKEYLSEKEYEIKNIIKKKEKAKSEKERIITMFQKGYLNEEEMGRKLAVYEKSVEKLNVEAALKSSHYAEYADRLEKDWNRENIPYIIEDILNKMCCDDKKLVLGLLLSDISINEKTIFLKGRL